MEFTSEFLKTLSSYKAISDLFVIRNERDKISIIGKGTNNKIVTQGLYLVVNAPVSHFNAGGDVGFTEFSRFFNMLTLATGGDFSKATIEPVKTSKGVASLKINSPTLESTMEFRMPELEELSLTASIWKGIKYKDEMVHCIPDEIVKAKFTLTKNDIDNVLKYGQVIESDLVTVSTTAADSKVTFSYSKITTGNKTSFSIPAEVSTDISVAYKLDFIEKLPKGDYNIRMAGNALSLEQIMPPVGEGDKAVPSDISVNVLINAVAAGLV